MADDFSISKEGIQLPYRRFLADSAAGFTLILLLCLAHYSLLPGIPQLNAPIGAPLPKDVRLFLLVVLFVLATPFGFVINAIGWFVMERPVAAMERRFFDTCYRDRGVFSVIQIATVRFNSAVQEYFALDRNTFSTAAWFWRDILEAYTPSRVQPHHHVRGLIIFLQNSTLIVLTLGLFALAPAAASVIGQVAVVWTVVGVAFLLIGPWTSFAHQQGSANVKVTWIIGVTTVAAFVLATCQAHVWWPLPYLVGAVVLLVITGAISFYQHSASLTYAFVVCCEYGIDSNDLSRNDGDLVLQLARRFVRQVRDDENAKA